MKVKNKMISDNIAVRTKHDCVTLVIQNDMRDYKPETEVYLTGILRRLSKHKPEMYMRHVSAEMIKKYK